MPTSSTQLIVTYQNSDKCLTYQLSLLTSIKLRKSNDNK